MLFSRNRTPDERPEIKIYADRCLTCNESQRVEVIQFVAQKHGYKVNMRRVYVLPELLDEALSFGVPMPFIELNNKTLDFFAVGEHLLEEENLVRFINEVKNDTTSEN